jgi:hypothetical protein
LEKQQATQITTRKSSHRKRGTPTATTPRQHPANNTGTAGRGDPREATRGEAPPGEGRREACKESLNSERTSILRKYDIRSTYSCTIMGLASTVYVIFYYCLGAHI